MKVGVLEFLADTDGNHHHYEVEVDARIAIGNFGF